MEEFKTEFVDPWHFGTDAKLDLHNWVLDPDPAMDPEHALFVSGFKDVKKISLLSKFFAINFLKVHLSLQIYS